MPLAAALLESPVFPAYLLGDDLDFSSSMHRCLIQARRAQKFWVLSSELEDDGKRERGETGGTSETGAT